METKTPISFLEIPDAASRRVDVPELYSVTFPIGNRPISEIDNLFHDKQIVKPIPGEDLSYWHNELKNFLLTLRAEGISYYFDELIAKISLVVGNTKDPEKALLFALSYRSKSNNLTLLEALDSTGNFRDAEKCESILYRLPVDKPQKYTMGRAFREMIGCFANAKTFEGNNWAGLRIELSDMAKEAILRRNIDAPERLKGKTIAMRLVELLEHPPTSMMAAKAFDILMNRFETVPNFHLCDQDGKDTYGYIGNTKYAGFAKEFLEKIEKALRENQKPHFQSEDPSVEALRMMGYPLAMRVNDMLNMVCGEDCEEDIFLNILRDPASPASIYRENDIIPRSDPSINDRA